MLHLKINIPGANKLPKPGLNRHTNQDADSNSSHSEDHENNHGYGHSYTNPISEFSPEIQNNIRIMGTTMLSCMCPPFSIDFHIPRRYILKHAMIKSSFKYMRQCWSDLKKSMTLLHFIKFTEAASAYSNILAVIAEKIITLPADLQRYDFTYMSAFSISQTLKYQKVQDNTCPNSSLSTRRLQALTSEDKKLWWWGCREFS